jgi:hypothetical protein
MVRWGAKESKECERQFNLFASTGGTQGWDPESTDAAYIKEKIIQAKNPIFAPFLAKSAGGSARDNQKALSGYRSASSEYFVKLAKNGIRISASSHVHSP